MKPKVFQSGRPLVVYVSLGGLVAIISVSLVRHAIEADWANPWVWVQFAIELVVLGVPLFFAFLGKSWARWLLVFYAVGGWLVAGSALRQHLLLHANSWLFRFALINSCVVAALVGLFLPKSTRWFHGGKDAPA